MNASAGVVLDGDIRVRSHSVNARRAASDESHFGSKGPLSDGAKKLIEQADRELRAELAAGTGRAGR